MKFANPKAVILFLIVAFASFLGAAGVSLGIESQQLSIKNNILIDTVDKNLSTRTSGEVQIRRLKNILYSDKEKDGGNLFDELLVLQKKIREKK